MAKKRTFTKVAAAGGELPSGMKSGSQLIRDQIAKGIEKPSLIIAAVKSETGVDVSGALVASVKQAAKKAGGAAPAKRGPKAGRPKGGSSSFGVIKAGNEGRDGKKLDPVEAAILLTEKFGAEQARQIISILGPWVSGG